MSSLTSATTAGGQGASYDKVRVKIVAIIRR